MSGRKRRQLKQESSETKCTFRKWFLLTLIVMQCNKYATLVYTILSLILYDMWLSVFVGFP
jgi:hypothetical protein